MYYSFQFSHSVMSDSLRPHHRMQNEMSNIDWEVEITFMERGSLEWSQKELSGFQDGKEEIG